MRGAPALDSSHFVLAYIFFDAVMRGVHLMTTAVASTRRTLKEARGEAIRLRGPRPSSQGRNRAQRPRFGPQSRSDWAGPCSIPGCSSSRERPLGDVPKQRQLGWWHVSEGNCPDLISFGGSQPLAKVRAVLRCGGVGSRARPGIAGSLSLAGFALVNEKLPRTRKMRLMAGVGRKLQVRFGEAAA